MAMYKGKKQKIRGRGYSYHNRYGRKGDGAKITAVIIISLLLVALGFVLSIPFFK